MNTSLILHRPTRHLPLRHLRAALQPGAVERYSFALLLIGVAVGSLGILLALLKA